MIDLQEYRRDMETLSATADEPVSTELARWAEKVITEVADLRELIAEMAAGFNAHGELRLTDGGCILGVPERLLQYAREIKP